MDKDQLLKLCHLFAALAATDPTAADAYGRLAEAHPDALKTDFFGKPRSERAQKFLSKILSH